MSKTNGNGKATERTPEQASAIQKAVDGLAGLMPDERDWSRTSTGIANLEDACAIAGHLVDLRAAAKRDLDAAKERFDAADTASTDGMRHLGNLMTAMGLAETFAQGRSYRIDRGVVLINDKPTYASDHDLPDPSLPDDREIRAAIAAYRAKNGGAEPRYSWHVLTTPAVSDRRFKAVLKAMQEEEQTAQDAADAQARPAEPASVLSHPDADLPI